MLKLTETCPITEYCKVYMTPHTLAREGGLVNPFVVCKRWYLDL